MNNEISRGTVLVALAGMLLATGVGWSYLNQITSQRRYLSERENLAECKAIAKKITDLRRRKQRALLRTKPTDELNRRIDAWAKQAGISSENLIRIQPREPRRIGDSQYLEQITELEVYETTLPKLIQFSQIAEQNGEGLKLSSLRVSPPRSASSEQGKTEVWSAEMALTYLIYSPKSG